jgi:hypothetical protein
LDFVMASIPGVIISTCVVISGGGGLGERAVFRRLQAFSRQVGTDACPIRFLVKIPPSRFVEVDDSRLRLI